MSEVVVHKLRPLHHRQRESRVWLVNVNEDCVADVAYAGQERAVRGAGTESNNACGQKGTRHVPVSLNK